jgi:3-dehydroquinate synthase
MPGMQPLSVDLGPRSYPIHIGTGTLGRSELYSPYLRGKVLIVTNETIAPIYLDRVRNTLAQHTPGTLVLPDGEDHKTLETTARIYDALLAGKFGRDGTLVALGGGVVGDLVGFAAATYQRGVDFIQVPTTLLAQVDSSVGGKTGVNHPAGKNMIGAFHQPRAVITDIDTLRTLPERELSAGIAEVVKYGLLGDTDFFEWLEDHVAHLRRCDPAMLAVAIRRSCQNKARIVAADERESGQRALLNLGHTFAHAIETAMGYGHWLHGEAVGAGMCMAADLSLRLGWLTEDEHNRAVATIAEAGLPVRLPPALTPDDFHRCMALDKKVMGGRIRLVLLQGIGRAVVTNDYDDGKLQETLEHFCSPPHAEPLQLTA